MTAISDMITVREAAELTGRHPKTIRRWIKDGGLSALKVRGQSGYEYRMKEEDVLDYMVKESS